MLNTLLFLPHNNGLYDRLQQMWHGQDVADSDVTLCWMSAHLRGLQQRLDRLCSGEIIFYAYVYGALFVMFLMTRQHQICSLLTFENLASWGEYYLSVWQLLVLQLNSSVFINARILQTETRSLASPGGRWAFGSDVTHSVTHTIEFVHSRCFL